MAVGAFPTRTQMTLGGAPSVKLRWWKSESFESTVKP